MTTIGEWNASASSRWNRLRTSLRQAHPDLEYMRTVEVQKRGALHLHIIVWSPEPLDPYEIQRLALGVGFGCQVDLAPIVPGSTQHACYVGKYVTKSTAERHYVPWNPEEIDRETGEISTPDRVATYRTWSQSRGFGVTMRFLRAEALAARNRQAARLLDLVLDDLAGTSSDPMPATAEAASP